MQPIQIAEAAARLGISVRTIRFYEEKGLISPSKTPHNGYRLFTGQDLLRLQTLLALRETGLSLSDLHTVMDTYGMDQREELLYLMELQRSVLYAERLDLDSRIRLNEEVIASLRTGGELSADALFSRAEAARREREVRHGWADHYRFDRQADTFDQEVGNGSPDYPGYAEALRTLLEAVDPREGESGIDLGTGTGNLAGALLARGVRMKAVDQSREMLRLCRRKHPLLETKLGNLLSVPYYEGTFDLAVSSYVLHRLTPDERLLALREALRILKPHGRLGLACPLPEEAWGPLVGLLRSEGFLVQLLAPASGVAVLLAVPMHRGRPGS
ncbi:MerR family transcriptional regulator [Gorillibacterium sp. sgz5001074]|uniref:MerR family transcriptional regulator n=1 Tax=Gorillibacterium sp. sgz5001074 TaxID=3446695 RepID=UPI003F6625D3